MATIGTVMLPGTSPRTLILYDGVCALCNGTVQFLLRHDQFRFAPLQSAAARSLLQSHGLDADGLHTVCVVANYGEASERVLTKSSAALYAAVRLGGWWKLSAAGYAIPRVLRDAVYGLVARHRYQMFGKYETCPLPPPLDRDKFIGL